MEATNRFKGLDLIERVPEELWTEVHDIIKEVIKMIPKEKKCKAKWRPFKYDINQIPNDYTVEVTNRSKGLYLVDRVPEELWTEVYNTVQESVTKMIPKKKKCKKAKWFSEEALQIVEETREVKGKGERERQHN